MKQHNIWLEIVQCTQRFFDTNVSKKVQDSVRLILQIECAQQFLHPLHLPQLDVFYFTTDEKKIFFEKKHCRCIFPNFINGLFMSIFPTIHFNSPQWY